MTDDITQQYLKSIIEAILFISEKPVAIEQIREVLDDVGGADIRQLITDLMQEYEGNNRGMVITEIAGGYQMLSNPCYAAHVRNFFKKRVKEKLSKPALETLAIVAYKQPVSRGDIELIRGVNSDGVVAHLLDKALIKIVGRKDIPGRPYLYGTTKLFLEYFGLKSLQDMPRLEEFPSLSPQEEGQNESVDLIHGNPNEEITTDHLNEEQETQEAPASHEHDGQESKDNQTQENVLGQEENYQTVEMNKIEESETPASESFSENGNDPGIEDASDLKKAMEDIHREERTVNTSVQETLE